MPVRIAPVSNFPDVKGGNDFPQIVMPDDEPFMLFDYRHEGRAPARLCLSLLPEQRVLYIAGADYEFSQSDWQGRWDLRTVLDGTLTRGRSIINVAFRCKSPTDFLHNLTFINVSYAESRWEAVGRTQRIVLFRLLPRPNFHIMAPVDDRGAADSIDADTNCADEESNDGFVLI